MSDPAVRVCKCGKKISILNKKDKCFACQQRKIVIHNKTVGVPATVAEPRMKRPYVRKQPFVGKWKYAPLPDSPAAPPINLPAPAITPNRQANEQMTKERTGRMDTLTYTEIDVDEIPKDGVGIRKPIGRIGEMWLVLEALPDGRAISVPCRDNAHAGYTARHMRLKAKQMNREMKDVVRRGSVLYLSLMPKGK